MRRMIAASSRLGVVVAEDVEHAVHDEQGQLVVERAGVVGGLVGGDGRAHDDIAEQHRHAWLRRHRPSSSGNDSTSVGPGVPRCSTLSAAISSRSTNVSVSSPATPSVEEHRAGEPGPSVDVDGDVVLLVGAHHDDLVGDRWWGWDSEAQPRARSGPASPSLRS